MAEYTTSVELIVNLHSCQKWDYRLKGQKKKKEFKNKMSDLIGFESPKIDWTPGPDLPQRLKRSRQKCELLFDGPLKAQTNEQRCRYVFL